MKIGTKPSHITHKVLYSYILNYYIGTYFFASAFQTGKISNFIKTNYENWRFFLKNLKIDSLKFLF